MLDPFRPRTEPAMQLYDAILEAANVRTNPHWVHHMQLKVFRLAREYASQNGLSYPTLAMVKDLESRALGHADYASKWAMYVAGTIKPVAREVG